MTFTHQRAVFAALATGAAITLTFSAPAQAQALDIDAPEIEKGEREVRLVNIANSGWRRGSTGEPRSSHELSTAYSPVDWFKLIAHIDAENLIGGQVIADHIGMESFVSLRKAGEDGGLALTWYTGAMISTDDLATNALVFGPIIKVSSAKAALTLNPYLEDTFGRNSGPGLNFAYGWQARYELSEQVAIGLEGFGKIEDIGNAAPTNSQDHRIGPAIFLSWDLADKRKLGIDLGVYAGLTDATPDVTFKLNSGVVF